MKIRLEYMVRVVGEWTRSAQLSWLLGGGKNHG